MLSSNYNQPQEILHGYYVYFCDGNAYISESFNIHHPQYSIHCTKKKLTARKVQNIYRWQKELSPYYKEDLICLLRGVNFLFLTTVHETHNEILSCSE